MQVVRWGRIVRNHPGFHTADTLYPIGYKARRLFWGRRPPERAVYTCEVTLKPASATSAACPNFVIRSSALGWRIQSATPEAALRVLRNRLADSGWENMRTRKASGKAAGRVSWDAFGLQPSVFFGACGVRACLPMCVCPLCLFRCSDVTLLLH